MSETSTKPYLLRAIYEWCTDNGYTPYLAAMVDHRTQVPLEFVKNGEIVLNISFSATSGLKMDNDFIHFHARFAGVSREIFVPVDNVVAIYARENGQGEGFTSFRRLSNQFVEFRHGVAGLFGLGFEGIPHFAVELTHRLVHREPALEAQGFY